MPTTFAPCPAAHCRIRVFLASSQRIGLEQRHAGQSRKRLGQQPFLVREVILGRRGTGQHGEGFAGVLPEPSIGCVARDGPLHRQPGDERECQRDRERPRPDAQRVWMEAGHGQRSQENQQRNLGNRESPKPPHERRPASSACHRHPKAQRQANLKRGQHRERALLVGRRREADLRGRQYPLHGVGKSEQHDAPRRTNGKRPDGCGPERFCRARRDSAR